MMTALGHGMNEEHCEDDQAGCDDEQVDDPEFD
jgi:hypothetical protein